MVKIINSPSKYIQGPNVLQSLTQYVTPFGTKALILMGASVARKYGDDIKKNMDLQNFSYVTDIFTGECSHDEIKRLQEICNINKVNVIIGIGGGKTLDTAKAVAHFQHCPVIIAPSIASTDAPTSALSVIYTPEGHFQEYLMLPKNPEVVLVDSFVISQAPVRLLVAGMGDALATYFEARANAASGKTSMAGGLPTRAALALAKLCFEVLLADGLKAKLAVQNQQNSAAVENIIEANTYLSGIGFESGGLAGAHAIHNGLTLLESCHHLYHGEKVAFGTLVQMVLENADLDEIDQVIEFCKSVGLPTCLVDMGAIAATKEQLMEVAQAACADGETIHNMPFKVTAQDVYSAILVANSLGSSL